MGNPQMKDKGFVDSGCSRHMTGNIAYLSNFKEFDGDTSYFDSSSKAIGNDEPKSTADDPKHVEDGQSNEVDDKDKSEDGSSTKQDNTATPEDMVGPSYSLEAPYIESLHEEDDIEVDLGNILKSYTVPTTPHTRIHINHPLTNVIGDIQSSVQTRRMKEPASEHGFLNAVYEEKTYEDLHTCLFACFLSKKEPKRVSKALSDPSWVETMQEELLQFKLQKTDERGIVIKNKARLVAQGYTQEKGIDYDDVFAPVARIEAIRLFVAYASFMGFIVYQIDVKSDFLYGTIKEE
ncbi:putative ribonuclease H-like domain-containing protein, partial [Tanacetum coccineum]